MDALNFHALMDAIQHDGAIRNAVAFDSHFVIWLQLRLVRLLMLQWRYEL